MPLNVRVGLAAAALLVAAGIRAGEQPRRSPRLIAEGKASFARNCALCHGPKGAGDGPVAKGLLPAPRNLVEEPLRYGSSAPQVFETISQGVKESAMTGFGHLPERERWGLAFYVLSLQGRHKGKADARR
jgi:mono/diheme cytochrome c family protein